MGIFDPSRALDPDKPIDLVNQYQRQMNRATYSPSVAQAAARSGINPTMATRIAARETSAQMAQAVPGLLQQEAQMMEARRLENERKEREKLAMAMNIGGQVIGTGLQMFGGGGGAMAGQMLANRTQPSNIDAVQGAARSLYGANTQPTAVPQAVGMPPQQLAQATAPAAVQQPLVDQPINYAQEIPEVWQATSGAPSNPADELLNTLPNQRNIRRRQPRQRRNG